MKIKQKFQVLLTITAVAMGGGTIATSLSFSRTNEIQKASRQAAQVAQGLTEIKASAISTIEMDPASEDTKRIYSDAEQRIRQWMGIIKPKIEDQKLRDQMRAAIGRWDVYDRKSHEIIDLAVRDPKVANEQMTVLYHSDFKPLQASLEQIVNDACNVAERLDDEATRMSENAERTVIPVMLVILVLLIGWIILLSRSVLNPLDQLRSTQERASASLDISQRVPSVGADEIGAVASAFNNLIVRVDGAMRSVRQSAESVAVAARQIASGNTDLSTRTEGQAASLEQTASSMAQLTQTVKQNSDNARQANTLAMRATDMADAGDAAVQEMVLSIGEVSSSSEKISQITGTIEGIAFQTNILALNAAVEAARAGEQGRGFAVVASEVRSLAQRSATAAKEVKDLIASSVMKIQGSVNQATEVGATMREVRQSIKQVSDIVGEIAAASEEQSGGIDHVGTAIAQMDEVTQQNAALVEQAAAAAQSLEEQATKLKEAVTAFKLSDSGSSTSPQVSQKKLQVVNATSEQGKSRTVKTRSHSTARGATIAAPASGPHDPWETF